ncbi:hypothetical protein ACWEKJ_16420 [Amycolatopsis thermoflava]
MSDRSPSPGLARRTLLQAAVGTPVAAAAVLGAQPVPAAEAAGGPADAESPRFTLAVVPDTQYLFDEGGSDPEPVRATFRHVIDRRREDGIVFLAHLGDVTEHGTTTEMRLADDVFRTIDGRMPYSVLGGNHDVSGDDQRGDTPYLRTFGPRRFARSATYQGSSPDGYNSFHIFHAAGRQWLLLALDWRVSDAGIAWTKGVLDAHRGLPTILTTHDLVYPEDGGGAHLSDHGQRLWDQVIRRHDQIFLAMGGHYWPTGRTTLTNDHGNPVDLHITNYQDRYYGGAGMLRYYAFDLVRGVIDVSTFSPWLQARRDPTALEAETHELTGDTDRFTVEVDFDRRFPPAPLPARPAAKVVIPGTVAYWRFDGEGLTGADGSRSRPAPWRGTCPATATTSRSPACTTDPPTCSPSPPTTTAPPPGTGACVSTAGRTRTAARCCGPARARRSPARGSRTATPSKRSSSCPTRSSATTRSWAS